MVFGLVWFCVFLVLVFFCQGDDISLEAHSMGGVSEPRLLSLALCAFSLVLCISLNLCLVYRD